MGTDKGDIQIWDVAVQKRIRTMTGHTQRVGVLAWSDHTLTSGSRDRKIYHRDVRTQEMYQQTLIGHSGEVIVPFVLYGAIEACFRFENDLELITTSNQW